MSQQWQPQQYDPRQHQQRIGGQPPQQEPYQYQPPYPRHQPYLPVPYAQQPAAWQFAQPPVQVAPKSTGLALFLGLLIPGLGCMYAGKAWLGVAILASWIVSLVLMLFIIGWLLVPACWIASGVLGYITAQEWNRQHGIIS